MAEQDEVTTAIPRRELRDPSVLRALAHPVRLRILEELTSMGKATATELAERIGESPANCSWHLRQLAQHGFIEEAGGGAGRQRPWKVVVQSNVLVGREADVSEPEFATARDTLLEVLMGREVEIWRAWQDARDREPAEWLAAAYGLQSSAIWLTAEELLAVKEELMAIFDRLVWPHLDRMEPDRRPTGSRPVRFAGWAIPSGPPEAGPPQPASSRAGRAESGSPQSGPAGEAAGP